MAQVLLGVLNLLVVAGLIGCVIGWVFGFLRLYKGQPLLQPEARFRSLVGFAEVIMAVGLFVVFAFAGLNAAQQFGWIEMRDPGANETVVIDANFIAGLMIDGAAKVAAVALLLVWLSFLDPHALRHLGAIPRLHDLKIGIIAAVMLIPPLLMLQLLLNFLTPYEHPVKDLIEARPTLLIGLLLAANTVLIAPISEEFFFRGLLQGWFQRVSRRGILHSVASEQVEAVGDVSHVESEGDATKTPLAQPQAEVAPFNPYEPLPPNAADAPGPVSSALTEWIPPHEVQRWPWWPMVLSSLLFGLIHWGQGAAPVSLFFLAMGLSYVTRQTGSLWPAITVHFVLNALSTTAMFLSAGLPTDPPPLGP